MTDPQVFLKNEILTLDDMFAIRNGYVYLYESEKDAVEKYKYYIAVGCCDSIIKYLAGGKKSDRGIE